MLFENLMFFLFFGKTFKKILIFLITVRDPVIRERIRFGERDHNSMFTRRNFLGEIFIIVSIIIKNIQGWMLVMFISHKKLFIFSFLCSMFSVG